jgi:hypothetical protein
MAYFQTQNPNLGKFAMVDLGLIYAILCIFGDLVYFVAIWYILWLFGIFFLFLLWRTKENLATLFPTRSQSYDRELYNASAVKIYSATRCLVHIGKRKYCLLH